MVKTCEISFIGNPQKVCYSGRKVFGRIVLNLDQLKTFKKLKILVYGHASVRWSTGTGRTRTTHADNIVYLNDEIKLMKASKQQKELILPKGKHVFHFDFEIPHNCPSSFEGSHGHIRYKVKLIFVNAILWDKVYSSPFTVINSLNLNDYGTNLWLPCKEEAVKNIFKLFKSRKLQVVVSVPKTGYVPGESIPVLISIQNDSAAKIKEISIKLALKVHCKLRYSKRSTEEKISLTKVKSINKKESSFDVHEIINIPATPPTLTDLCKIIHLNYSIRVEVKLAGAHTNQEIKIPIVIGVIPLGVDPMEDSGSPPPSYREPNYMIPALTVEDNEHEQDVNSTKFVPKFPLVSYV